MIPAPFDIARLREGYRALRFTPSDVATEAFRRIAAYKDPAVWIARVPESDVMARARALTAAPLDAEKLPLYGIPFAVKDNIDCAGLPTTAACPAFAYEPTRDARVIERLLAAGAILIGKTNLDQFATGLVGTRSPYGAPRCVFDDRYISGGSSSGSAVAVAAGLVAFALGTDTAGSGRVPAAFNNIVGWKPTRGLLSAAGVVPACRSLDCVSIFAQTVGDAAEIARVAQDFDSANPFSRRAEFHALPQAGFRFGVLAARDREFFGDGDMASLYDAAIARLAGLGGEPIEIDFAPFQTAGALLYDGPWVAERLAAIKDFIAKHEEAMDPTVRTIIAAARGYTAADAFEGQYRLAGLAHQADAQWAHMDFMLLPTAPAQYAVAEVTADPIALNKRLGRYTNFVNLLDTCAVAVPAGFRGNGLAFGVTLVAPAFCDHALGATADRLHRAGNFGMGAAREAALPSGSLSEIDSGDRISLFVVGAHLSGMPLNPELRNLGAVLLRPVRTAKSYRLFVLPHTAPPKPGLLREPSHDGPGIAGEVWSLSPDAFGRFVARIPAPLGIGKVELEDGSLVSGFLCEAHAVEDAVEITAHGGWENYLKNRK
jgi:allophanate hydrolase